MSGVNYCHVMDQATGKEESLIARGGLYNMESRERSTGMKAYFSGKATGDS